MNDKMDRARRASEDRDALRKPHPEELSRALDENGPARKAAYRALKRKKIDSRCPDCKGSTDFLQWDAPRSLWVHPRCGGTWTPDELDYINQEDS